MDSHQLPFELTIAATTDWLQSISHLNCVNSADQLNKAIKQLRSIESETTMVLDILLLLTPTILSVCSTIELSFLVDSDNKTTNKSRKIEKLCFQLLKHYVSAVSQIVSTKKIPEKDLCSAIYMAIQLIGFSQRLSATAHQTPTPSLWKQMGELYLLAQDNNILQQEIDHNIKDFNSQTSIESAIKCTLLLSILAPYQCTTHQIRALFLFAHQHSNLLEINTQETNDCYFWNPESETPPHRDNTQISDTRIIINTRKLLPFAQPTAPSTLVDEEVLTHIINQLSAYEELINSVTPSMLIINHLFVGFTDISEYLQKISKLNKIQQLSSQYTETKPKDAFSSMSATLDQGTSNSGSKDSLLETAITAKILNTKNDQFVITETNQIDCQVGNIILFCKSDNTTELGIVKQLKTTNQSGTTHTLIEKIQGTLTLELVNSPEVSAKQALIINNKNAEPIIFLPPCKLSNGTRIITATDKNYVLDRLVDFSPYYIKFQTTNAY